MQCMKTLMALAVMNTTAVAAAQQTPDPRNAATWYQQAITQFQTINNVSPQDVELIWNYDPSTSAPTPELRAALSRVQGVIDTARRAMTQEYCDFQTDRSQGFEMMLPHLSPMRSICKLMKADVMVRLHDGDTSGAASSIADLYRMSNHFSDDRIIISSLVGQAVFSLTDSIVQHGVDRGMFGVEESQAMLQGISRLNTTDPFDYLEAVAGEQELAVGWLQEKFSNSEDPLTTAKEMASILGTDEGGAFQMQLMMMDQGGLAGAIESYDAVMNRVVEIFSMPDDEAAKAAVKELEAEIEQHQHGVLASMLLPAFGKVLENRFKAEKMLADRIATLEALAQGQAKPDEVANAALWYMRGIELLERIEADTLHALRVFAADTSAPVSDELSKALASPAMQEVIDMFRDGSRKKRCDFAFARSTYQMCLTQPYAAGMHDAMRLLQADAVRLLREKEHWLAVDRLETCFRVAAHMGGDLSVVSALVSHINFNRTLHLANAALHSGALPDESKPVLADGADRMSRKDPFGYIGALVQTRNDLAKRLGQGYTRDEEERQRQIHAAEIVKLLSGDQLLYLLAIVATLEDNARAAAQAAAANDGEMATAAASISQSAKLARLYDVISIADLEAAQSDIPHIAPMLAQRDLEFFSQRIIPAIAASAGGQSLADHVRRARSDLRRAHLVLRMDVDETANEE